MSSSAVTFDRRYGCSRCDNNNLPGLGYLDRLRKGVVVSKRQYSLQQHVETYHPEVTDWMSLKVELAPAPRPGTRKRKAAQISGRRSRRQQDDDEDEDEDEDEDDEVDNDNDDQQDEDEDRGNGDDNAEDDAEDDGVDPYETGSDSDDTRAKKMARRRSRSPRPASPLWSPDSSASPPPAPNHGYPLPTSRVIVLPLVPAGVPTVRLAPIVDPISRLPAAASVAVLRRQNTQLRASNANYRAANNDMRQQVAGLLRGMVTAVSEEIFDLPFSNEAVQNALMHFTRGNGELVGEILDRVVAGITTPIQFPPRAPMPPVRLAPRVPSPAAHMVNTRSQSRRHRTPPQVIVSSTSSSELSDVPSDL